MNMTFENYQDRMAERLQELTTQKEKFETAISNIEDIDSPLAIELDGIYRHIVKQINTLEQIAFYIVQQEDELNRLREENARQNNQIVALRQMNNRYYIQLQVNRAIAKLHQSKWQSLEKAADEWAIAELGQEINEIEKSLKNL